MFDVENIGKAVNDMSLSVALDCEKLCIMHLLYAHPAVTSCLSRLYKAIVIHEYVPERFGLSVINPIVNNSMKSVNDISNYRPISIMPIISKVFEKYIGYVLKPYFVFHDNQFGFGSNEGCGRALFEFKNVVDYFTGCNSKVFCCSLDISKAFDRINHFALLRSIYNKGIPTNIIKIFANWWCKLNDTVPWKGKLSVPFPIGSGILQGSLLGGNFFKLMMDSVLQILHKCGLRCHVGNVLLVLCLMRTI